MLLPPRRIADRTSVGTRRTHGTARLLPAYLHRWRARRAFCAMGVGLGVKLIWSKHACLHTLDPSPGGSLPSTHTSYSHELRRSSSISCALFLFAHLRTAALPCWWHRSEAKHMKNSALPTAVAAFCPPLHRFCSTAAALPRLFREAKVSRAAYLLPRLLSPPPLCTLPLPLWAHVGCTRKSALTLHTPRGDAAQLPALTASPTA